MHLKTILIAVICLIQLFMIECISYSITSGKHKILLDIPTFMCDRYGINFSDVFRELKDIQNQLGSSENVEIKIFNNPEILGKISPERMKDISYAYNQRHDILTKVNKIFNGMGILNYTAWQPIFRQNRGPSQHFYNSTMQDERSLYPLLNESQSIEIATMRFEFASRTVLSETIMDIRKFLPSATWGLFDYPKCNFLSTENLRKECDEETIEDNNKLSWLWKLKIALYPHINLSSYLTREFKRDYVNARLKESKRIADKCHPKLKIFPYLSLKYLDDPDHFISFVELFTVLQQILQTEIIDGVIIMTTENDLSSKEKCRNHEFYFSNELIPFMKNFFNL